MTTHHHSTTHVNAQVNTRREFLHRSAQLTSHSDQIGAWQTGWFGHIGDLTSAAYNPSSGVSIVGNNMLQADDNTIQCCAAPTAAGTVGS